MLPNLVIIGTMKGGTSSLHYYLGLHPQISMSKIKELNFFVDEFNWTKGIKWYESHFQSFSTKIIGETSPPYTAFPKRKGVPQRMHSVVPDAKLIYILRDPIKRIISQYIHLVHLGVEKRTISEALEGFNNDYIFLSKYYMQIEQYLMYFKQANILVITSEELYKERQQTLKRVFQFLDVDSSFYTEEYSNVIHRSAGKKTVNRLGLIISSFSGQGFLGTFIPLPIRRMLQTISYSNIRTPLLNDNMYQQLNNVLRNDIDQLRKLTGRKYDEWSI